MMENIFFKSKVKSYQNQPQNFLVVVVVVCAANIQGFFSVREVKESQVIYLRVIEK